MSSPVLNLIKKVFKKPVYGNAEGFEERAKAVTVYKDIAYPSNYPSAVLDIALPSTATKRLPVVFWMHGGGYVAGDKSDYSDYVIALAHSGCAVINFNYALAPETNYPSQIHQIGEVYNFIKEHAGKYNIDMQNVFFAGDSAGAHMISQFVNIQTNPGYSRDIGISPVVTKNSIRGAMLFCGFYDFVYYVTRKRGLLKFFFKRIARAYFGRNDWLKTPETQLTVIKNHLSADFPPCFITDGNKWSFENQARELEKALLAKGVETTGIFHAPPEVLKHEYQFKMDTLQAQQVFDRLTEFILNKTNR